MDERLKVFEEWYLSQKENWNEQGVTVTESGADETGQYYWIKVHSENGFGNIVLYERNGSYLVDFEAANFDYDVVFCRKGIDFRHKDDLNEQEHEFITHIIWDGSNE